MNKVLLIYTGGTIGMGQNPQTGALEPLDFNHLVESMPEFQLIKADIDVFKETEIAQSRDRVSKICRVKQIAVFQRDGAANDVRFRTTVSLNENIVDPGFYNVDVDDAVFNLYVLNSRHHITVRLKALAQTLNVIFEKDSVKDHARLCEQQFFQFVFFVDSVAMKMDICDRRIFSNNICQDQVFAVGLRFSINVRKEPLIIDGLNVIHNCLLVQLISNFCFNCAKNMLGNDFIISFNSQR